MQGGLDIVLSALPEVRTTTRALPLLYDNATVKTSCGVYTTTGTRSMPDSPEGIFLQMNAARTAFAP